MILKRASLGMLFFVMFFGEKTDNFLTTFNMDKYGEIRINTENLKT